MAAPDRLALDRLVTTQEHVASREQLRRVGVDRDRVRREIAAGRWRAVPPLAVVLHNGPLTRRQAWWVAVFNAGPGAALCARTALEADGLTGWTADHVEVLVRKSRLVPAAAGIYVHESRRFDRRQDLHPTRLPPRTRPARSAIDAAAWSRSPRTAVGLLAAVVQQGLARPGELADELERAGRVRHCRLLTTAIADIAGGSRALSEIDFVRLCRRYALPVPNQQVLRTEPSGRRRYLDAEWVFADGRRVVAEVDGAVHLLPRRYWDDMHRANEVVLAGATVLRFAAFSLRAEPELVAAQLRRALLSV